MRVMQLPNQIPLAKIDVVNQLFTTETVIKYFDLSLYRLETMPVKDVEANAEKFKRDAELIAAIASEYFTECTHVKSRRHFNADSYTVEVAMDVLFSAFSALREIRYYQQKVTGNQDNTPEEVLAECGHAIMLTLNTLDGNAVKNVAGYHSAVKLYGILEDLSRQAVEEYETVKAVTI